MSKKTIEENETQFIDLLQAPPYPVAQMIELIEDVPAAKGDEWTLLLLQALVEASDFNGAFELIKVRKGAIGSKLQGVGIRDALKKTTKDRLILSFIDSVGFDVRPLKEAIARLERLLSFQPSVYVLSQAWGLGIIKRLDYFYRRITVDFRQRKGHQLSFDAACETLAIAPENHILVTAAADPSRMQAMIKDTPDVFVREMLKSFGDMSVVRLEELASVHGFIKAGDAWKKFWERARTELRKDKCVEIPTKRTEPIHIKAAVEAYDDNWFVAFTNINDPKSILSSVRELQMQKKLKDLSDDDRSKISERLAFALKGARRVDDALYARLAFCVEELGLSEPPASTMRNYLWENNRFLAAARELPARETGALVKFLTKENTEETKMRLFAVLPEMCFSFLTETLRVFEKDAQCEEAVVALLRDPKAPATIVTLILARYDEFSKNWKSLPPLSMILTHAIALGEGRQSGETLRMQNTVRRLFADQKWLEGIFKQLDATDQAIFFERFQASIAWDPSTHHLIVVRMTHIVPELASRLVKVAKEKPVEHVTSMRSYAERKAAYQKLITVEIPENVRDIQEAKEKGDLSENAEYQYAKDKERLLQQKQAVIQEELKNVKPFEFADVATDEVRAGTTVTITTATGAEVKYTILGEWDNDLSRNIISNQTKLAQNMLGKKVGDLFDMPDAEGNLSQATVKGISELSAEVREWMKVPAGLNV